ncbi:ABC transporter permease [Clostridium saccharoperbutylacetonicum]|jgi:simple sugar transport system permease protein|uniref:Monosaccharide ABC transporter membrane protein, CUT2 family n=1 Tax=Clostridium saccharoperbutylacetonicum N1-4(HMT) TaxID=931276 RepID=M1LYS9_9CLOT|nr:ABC transporter permease [Clostridium saccharoperbutylacetonicum]AGF58450.1 monosaccharide ABC transporter membrane protein, CUT2 family [Clostridium saccharoperbutylacetonicum N1-4(HMT)]AQR97143.1 inner membrane ABC transporter permease protein YtfT [Clostridium saccharoperbutylacetonicum]NRT60772.1 simple sugar transport system permease protein [Clostridium saccharoperbutylacetonicum]NSB24086.1 simple sugar transport system permease protein [Clostridium saccharoperbutylacetonicum]NSB33024
MIDKKEKNFFMKIYNTKIFWPLASLIILLLFNFIMTPSFLSITMKDGHLFGNTIDILNRAAPLILISLGMTIVIATQGIDISVGSIIAISAALSATVIVDGGSVPMAVAVGIISGLLCGVWNGFLVSYIGVQPMVGTLILYIVGRGIAQLITGGQILTFTNKEFIFIGTGYVILPVAIFIVFFVGLIMYALIRKTALGLFIESIGVNSNSCKFAGIQSRKVVFSLYVICGVLAGIAGIILCANIKSADANNVGLWLELDAILATVIGGTSMVGGRFYLAGTVVGALFIQTLTTTIYSLGVPPEITLVVKAIVVIVVCIIQSPEFRKMIRIKKTSKNEAKEKEVARA